MMREETIEVRIPASLLAFGLNQDEVQRRITEWMVLSLVTEDRISSGKAANLLGMSRVDFLALLRQRGIAYIDYTPEELAEEFEAVDALKSDVSQ